MVNILKDYPGGPCKGCLLWLLNYELCSTLVTVKLYSTLCCSWSWYNSIYTYHYNLYMIHLHLTRTLFVLCFDDWIYTIKYICCLLVGMLANIGYLFTNIRNVIKMDILIQIGYEMLENDIIAITICKYEANSWHSYCRALDDKTVLKENIIK